MSTCAHAAPLVTIYLTCHNYGLYVRQAIESVLAQTLKDYELIIIDDGSTDNSRQVIEEYLDRDKVRIIFQQNKGLNVTNNIAIRAARGRYIMRLDADDWLDENALELLSNYLERNPQVALVFPDYYLVDRDGQIIQQVRRHNFDEVTVFDQPAHGACTMIRLSDLRRIGGYDERLNCQDGVDLWYRFIRFFKVNNIRLPLFFYRRHGDNLTRQEIKIRTARSQILAAVAGSMGNQMKVLAVITVRGEPTEQYSAPLRLLANRPLIDWTIKAARESRKLSKIVVTSPDLELLGYVRSQYSEGQVLVIERPKSLALENSSITTTLNHALKTVESRGCGFDAILQLSVESPFRSAVDIDAAIDTMQIFDADVVIGVRPDLSNLYRHNGHGLSPLNDSSILRLERDEIYRAVGSMRLMRREFVINDVREVDARVCHVVLDKRSAMAIQSDYDWNVIELLARE